MKRNLAIALVAGAVIAGGGTGWAIAASHHTTTTAPPTSTHSPSAGSTATSHPSSSPTRSTGPKIVSFGASGITLTTRAGAGLLEGTSADFQQFIADQVTSAKAACPSGGGVEVDRYAANGFAVGAVNDCGGYRALWTNKYGAWKLIFGTQDTWYCQVLSRYGVPQGLIDHCLDNPGTPVKQSGPVKITSFHDPAHPGLGIYVQKASDTRLLTGTSTAFRDFIGAKADTATAINNQKKTCDAGGVGITVGGYATNGYAIGAVNDCGGYAAIWGDIGYGWQELIGSQAEFVCQELHDDGVPVGLVPGDDTNGNVGMCWDLTTKKSIRYAG